MTDKTPAMPEPTQEQLDAFIKRAGFSYGWMNLESSARRMAERAVWEIEAAKLATLQAQPAEVSDEEINRIVYEHTKLNPNQADDVELLTYIRNAVRAILALRPQAVPVGRAVDVDGEIRLIPYDEDPATSPLSDGSEVFCAPLNLNCKSVQKRLMAQWGYEVQPAREPMTDWQPLDAARLNSEEFDGAYWLAMKNGEVAVGEYEWRQGWNPHGFNLIDGGRVGAFGITHTATFVRPSHPAHGITAPAGGEKQA